MAKKKRSNQRTKEEEEKKKAEQGKSDAQTKNDVKGSVPANIVEENKSNAADSGKIKDAPASVPSTI